MSEQPFPLMYQADYGNEEYQDGTQQQQIQQETTTTDDDQTYNIFVGDLKSEVVEDDLKAAFSACGEIHSAHIFRDPQTNEQKGFGFVHFKTKEAQTRALTDEFNHIMIKGRPCRVSYSEQRTTLFVGNLPMELTQQELQQEFVKLLGVGVITSCELKTGPPPSFESRGFCFLTLSSHNKADQARKVLAASSIRGRLLNVSWAENRFKQYLVDDETMAKVKTLYVSNVSMTVSDQVLIALFSEHGTVISCNIVKNPQTGQSKGFAFVEMDSRENAEKALNSLNGSELVGQKISVVLAKPPPKPSAGRGRGRGFMPRGMGFNQPNPMGPYPPAGPQRFHPGLGAPRGPRAPYQTGGRGGKQRGRGGYQQAGYQQPYGQTGGYQTPARYQPYQQQNRQPYAQQPQQSYSGYSTPQMYPQMYGQSQQYYQGYSSADQSQAAQQYYQYYQGYPTQ